MQLKEDIQQFRRPMRVLLKLLDQLSERLHESLSVEGKLESSWNRSSHDFAHISPLNICEERENRFSKVLSAKEFARSDGTADAGIAR
jgi:hypothetical protein